MPKPARVVIVGGGIAGLAAAVRLGEQGFAVTLFERRPLLGGRASSFPLIRQSPSSLPEPQSPVTEIAFPALETLSPVTETATAIDHPRPDLVDNCQHVLMRCCVNLLDFYRRIGALDSVKFFDRFYFVDRRGRWSTLSGSRWLPAPFHLLPSFFRFRSMKAADKVAIAYAMNRLMRLKPEELQDHQTTFADWLRRMRQTSGAIECFWRPVVVSALNEEPERTAAAYAFQLFRQAFLRSRHAFEMGLPGVELAEIYSSAGEAALQALGVEVRAGEKVSRIVIEGGRSTGVCVGGNFIDAHVVISAVPHHALLLLLDEEIRTLPVFAPLANLESSPITGIHLWFDRPITDQPHVALVGREMQWIFAKDHTPTHSCLGLVVSASRILTEKTQGEIVKMAVEAVHDVFPESQKAKVVREVVIREKRATFSPCPGAEALRPETKTPIQNFYLAGDWIRTGWPATMEGAVRGGYMAAEAVLRDWGENIRLLSDELEPDFLPRLLGL